MSTTVRVKGETNYTRISLSIDKELLSDIDFMALKVQGIATPKNSYGKIFYELLRPIVPDRNAQVTDEASENNGDSYSSTD